jgi:hypothetical protein
MMKTIDIAWLAGIVEGEGCLSLQQGKYPALAIRMSDHDIVCRAASLMDTRVTGPYKTRAHYKPTWLCQVNGAKAAAWIMTLYVLLGERRKEKAREILSAWKSQGSDRALKPPRAPRGYTTPATCHPERPVRGGGLCKECYMKQYRQRQSQSFAAGALAFS